MPISQEGLKAGAVSAVIEGGVTLGLEIRKKVKSGKSIKDFTTDDWTEICKKSGLGTVKGGVRGISIYALTNYTATPAAVANALVTASFGIAQQAYLLKEGKITQEDFLRNSEELCVDVSVSALSSFIGQAIIPIPVVGAVIGNTIGNLIYQTAKDSLKKQDKQLVKRYIQEIEALTQSLDIDKKEALYDLIEKENRRLGVSTESQCIRLLVYLLTRYPELYSRIHCDTQKQVDNFINANPKAKALSWYCFDTIDDHYDWLAKQSIITFREDNIDRIVSRYQEEGKESLLFDFFITTYISSRCFDNADTSFQKLISPYLTRFTKQQLLNIIEGTNKNYQLHGRAYSESANSEIMNTTSSILEDIDLSQYTNFKYSTEEESDDN